MQAIHVQSGSPGQSRTGGRAAEPEPHTLEALAQRHGILTTYLDMAGRRQEASPETLRALLDLWQIPTSNSRAMAEAWRELELRSWRQCLEPVIVAWDGRPRKVDLRLRAEAAAGFARCTLSLEDGRQRPLAVRPGQLPTQREVELDGTRFQLKTLSLPALPFGYHVLEFEWRGRISRSMVVSAPRVSYAPPRAPRQWAAFLPMYAAHSERSWGAGSLGDWRELTRWIHSLGGEVLSTLPLTAAFLGKPLCESSPYSPASRLFWNEFYLDIEEVPELATCRAAQQRMGSSLFQQRLAEFRRQRLIDYPAQMAARREVLELLARSFFNRPSKRREGFERFLRERPQVRDYAEFRATCEQTGCSWHRWDQRLRCGKLQSGDFAPNTRDYHLYVQWLAQEQVSAFMGQCRRRHLQFYLDLPAGANPDGYDLWRAPDTFAFPASAGAPPDMFFTQGQNWGFAPPHPHRQRERGYDYLLTCLRFQMRHTGLLRIDHVMGLHRLYWIPRGFPASQGAYVAYPAEEWHALLSLESHRHRTALVGENLGTVPPEVNAALQRHGIRQTYVVQYEIRPNPKQALPSAPRLSVASLNTHDMPPFAAHWNGLDLVDRARLGLIPPRKLPVEQRRRQRLNQALTAFLRCTGWLEAPEPDADAVVRACLAWLAASPAEFVQVNLEDLWLETEPQNVPGTWIQRPNWRRKARLTIEQMRASPHLRALLLEISQVRRKRPIGKVLAAAARPDGHRPCVPSDNALSRSDSRPRRR